MCLLCVCLSLTVNVAEGAAWFEGSVKNNSRALRSFHLLWTIMHQRRESWTRDLCVRCNFVSPDLPQNGHNLLYGQLLVSNQTIAPQVHGHLLISPLWRKRVSEPESSQMAKSKPNPESPPGAGCLNLASPLDFSCLSICKNSGGWEMGGGGNGRTSKQKPLWVQEAAQPYQCHKGVPLS